MTANDIHLDSELAHLLHPPTVTELTILRDSLRSEGLLSPLLVWPTEGRLLLLDGFARLKLAEELKVQIRWTEVPLPDRDAAIEFRLRQQLARRNLPAIAQAYLRGRLYLLMGKRQGARTDLPKGKADAQLTARGVAERFNCSERTIRRDQRLAEAIDLIGQPKQQGPDYKAQLLAGKSNLKGLHPWQQAVEPAVHWLRRLTRPGDLVADPFLGSGTTAVVARQVGGPPVRRVQHAGSATRIQRQPRGSLVFGPAALGPQATACRRS